MFPLVRAHRARDARRRRPAPQPFLQTRAAQLGGNDAVAARENPTAGAGDGQGRHAGPGVDRRGGGGAGQGARAGKPRRREDSRDDQPKKPETRVAAIGDSDFAANAYLGVEGNRDLFMNTVNWLAQQENLIAIRPREPADRRLTLDREQDHGDFWLSIFVIPGAVLGAGVYTWWRRR